MVIIISGREALEINKFIGATTFIGSAVEKYVQKLCLCLIFYLIQARIMLRFSSGASFHNMDNEGGQGWQISGRHTPLKPARQQKPVLRVHMTLCTQLNTPSQHRTLGSHSSLTGSHLPSSDWMEIYSDENLFRGLN